MATASKLVVDVANTDGGTPKRSLADLLADEMDEVVVPATATLPSAAVPKRQDRVAPIPDLTGTAPVWCFIGSGDSGKTTVAKTLAGKQLERHPETMERTLLLASDPGARLLAEFFQGVMQPPDRTIARVVEFQRRIFGALPSSRAKGAMLGGYFDLGADAIAFGELLASGPTLPTQLREGGVSLIGAYVFTPATDDVAQLAEHQRLGVAWPATVLILNLGRADSPAAFEPLRRTPEYRTALAAGAVELWWPKLAPQELALWIESRRFLFHEARDGLVPAGNPNPPIPGVYRPVVRQYLDAVDAETAAIEAKGYMPWLA